MKFPPEESALIERAKSGEPHAQLLLGLLVDLGYLSGVGLSDATKWIRFAAESGSALAQFVYAESIWSDSDRDRTEAIRYYESAATQGHSLAQNRLGFVYENGLGVSRSMSIAIDWYKRSADGGCANAAERLAEIAEAIDDSDFDVPPSLDSYIVAAKLGSATAAFAVAERFERGIGVQQSDNHRHVGVAKRPDEQHA